MQDQISVFELLKNLYQIVLWKDEYTNLKSETNNIETNNLQNNTKINFTDISIFEKQKNNYINYGSIYRKNYCIKTD